MEKKFIIRLYSNGTCIETYYSEQAPKDYQGSLTFNAITNKGETKFIILRGTIIVSEV